EAVKWIAQLGGFLARKNDGEPGPITLWRGWKRLVDLAEGWNLALS
ncbi:TPA: IS4 family transposase, partial [Legionella pneumophila]|nr:IS4 family transposase [Legionella pneumophila]